MTGDSGFEEDFHSPSTAHKRVKGPNKLDPPYRPTLHHCLYSEYQEDHFIIQWKKQKDFLVHNCLANQTQITSQARCVLVSWLIELYKFFDLTFESCCLAVNIMDRFLAMTPVAADCFQLLGVASFLIATKYVEVRFPSIKHLLALCCNAFTKVQLCNLESRILININFRMSSPTIAFFLDHFISCELSRPEVGTEDKIQNGLNTCMSWKDSDLERCKCLSAKVCELSLADYTFNKYQPSVIARSALNLSRDLLRGQLNKSPIQHNASIHTPIDVPWVVEKSSKSLDDPNLIEQCTHELELLASINKELLQDLIKL